MWTDGEIIDATMTPDALGQTELPTPLRRRFPLGCIFITPGAADLLAALDVSADSLVARHAAGDWGDIDAADRGLNERGLRDGDRVFSVYALAPDARVWVITEADRASTTVLQPEEY